MAEKPALSAKIAVAGRRRRTIARATGEILMTGGVVSLLFVVYGVFVTDALTDRRQDQLNKDLRGDGQRRRKLLRRPAKASWAMPLPFCTFRA